MQQPHFINFRKSNCKNCHKCIRYCPVKSIRFTGNQANVIPEECILCGECYVVCPQNAKEILDERELVGVLLHGEEPVIASVAPSFISYFDGVGIDSLKAALKTLGFANAEETAIGATLVKREYERIATEGAQDIIITSCCPTINNLVEKYYPQLTGCLAPVVTPMQAHCADIRRRVPNAKVVFIGPCLSKKREGYDHGVDAVLTFEETAAMFATAGITLEDGRDFEKNSRTRIFPTSGGVINSMLSKNPDYTYYTIDGLDSCIPALADIANGNIHKCFVEMSACAGSCVRGPIMRRHHNKAVRDYQAVAAYSGEKDFDVAQPAAETLKATFSCTMPQRHKPGQFEISEILRKMGKVTPADELNCGTCGYNTCREKAVAIYQGKAEINMCLPYLMETSERFTDNILDNSPNGILVVNDSFEIQLLNKAAMKMLHVRSRGDVLGEPLIRLIDPMDFIGVLHNQKHVTNKRDYYAEYDSYLELTIVNDKKSGNLIGIFRDVTDEENQRMKKEVLSRQTIETADNVVEKQMRIVQEIASLLGETAAETKIALTKLKESIADEN